MTKIRVLPHRAIDAPAVMWGDWEKRTEGGWSLVPQLMKDWDYSTELKLASSATIDLPRALESSGLDSSADLEFVIIVDCPSANLRLVGSAPVASADGETRAEIDVPAGILASELRLSSALVRRATSKPEGDRAAWRRGSVLARSARLVVSLEGSAGRFPTEPVDFEAIGRPPAPWTIVTTFDTLDESFLGTVRLLVNVGHPAGRLAVEGDGPEVLDGVLKTDIVRRLLMEVAANELELDGPFEDESVGSVLIGMCELYLAQSLPTAVNTLRSDPGHFEDLLHAAIDPLRSVSPA